MSEIEQMCVHGFPIEFSPRVVQKVLNKVGCPFCLAERVVELKAENERLAKSWMAMEKRERKTDKEIDELRQEANELVCALRGEVSVLENRINEVREIYAGMEVFEPETAPEAYCLRIIEQMYKATTEGVDDE